MSHRKIFLSACALLAALAAFHGRAAPPVPQALSLTEAQRLAVLGAPQIEAQAAAVRAAQAARSGASELPDPRLLVGLDNVPVDTADRFNLTRDFMTMRKIGVMQDFTRDEKLKLRGDRAAAEARKEAALLSLAKVDVARDAALAWIERYFAEQQAAALRELARESELQIAAAEAALSGGKGQAADAFAARLGAELTADKIIDAERMIARSRAMLARWIGAAAQLPLGAPPAFDTLEHVHDGAPDAAGVHPHLAMYGPMQAMADADVRLAEAAKRPDWSLEVAYAQRGPAYSNMLSIGVRIDLPIFPSRRQDPAVASKVAMAEQVRAQADDARRMHFVEIDALRADWEAARRRVAHYESSVLPLARERTAVAMAGYRGGKADIGAVIEARKTEIDLRVAQLQAQADMARAWASLNFLFAADKERS